VLPDGQDELDKAMLTRLHSYVEIGSVQRAVGILLCPTKAKAKDGEGVSRRGN
jgi:hypothetical protein